MVKDKPWLLVVGGLGFFVLADVVFLFIALDNAPVLLP